MLGKWFKTHNSPEYRAIVIEKLPDGTYLHSEANPAYCEEQALLGVYEHRGYRVINGIGYNLYYLPPPPQY